MSTLTILIKVMEDYSTTAIICSIFLQNLKFILVDEGSYLVKECESMKLTFNGIKLNLHMNSVMKLDTSPVGGHDYNVKIERRICQIKDSLEKNIQNENLSILQRETLLLVIPNTTNDLPHGLGNIIGDYENMDLINPNPLFLGSNDGHSPAATKEVTGNPGEILKENKRILNSWFETWLVYHVQKLMNHPKWF